MPNASSHGNSTGLIIRPAQPADAALILRFIRELAAYEKAQASVVSSEKQIADSLFATDSPARALICLKDGIPIGFAVYFFNYSTWLGRPGLYLEDLYISPRHRQCGAGKALLRHLAGEALAKGCGRFEWSVLDWNTPAIGFYENLGATAQSEWTTYRLSGEALQRLATGRD